MKKSYEILPPGMGSKGTEGTKAASSISSGVPTYTAPGTQAFGLSYDSKGAVPMYGGAMLPRMGKQTKSYELIPGTGVTSKGLGTGTAGCGCGGKCGGEEGRGMLPRATTKSGRYGPSKVGGCGCGGKCGGADGGILPRELTGMTLPPSIGVMHAQLWLPPYGGTPLWSPEPLTGVLSPGILRDPTKGLEFPLWTPSCADLRAVIDLIVAKIRFLETYPTPERATCESGGCNGLPAALEFECNCSRISRGLPPSREGNWTPCPMLGPWDLGAESRRAVADLCNPGPAVSHMLAELRGLLDRLRRQRCEDPPPLPPEDFCRRHPEICADFAYCFLHPTALRCLPSFNGTVLPIPVPPPPPPVEDDPPPVEPADCAARRADLDRVRQIFFDIMAIHARLVELTSFLLAAPPLMGSAGLYPCRSAPTCPQLLVLRNSLEREFLVSPAPRDGSLNAVIFAIRARFTPLRVLLSGCDSDIVVCTDAIIGGGWAAVGALMRGLVSDVLGKAREAAMSANSVLDTVADDLFAHGCRIPDRLVVPR